MHYVAFLMDHGMAPYREIREINSPGAFGVDWLVVHALGAGPFAWRCFDLALTAVAGAAMVAVSRPYDWFAGVFAGALFAVIHGRDGILQAGQRDFVIAVLLLVGYAALFRATRGGSVLWMLGFGVCAGCAAIIKPIFAVFGPLILLLLPFARRGCGRARSTATVTLGVMGLLLPLLGAAVFLWRHHASQAFVQVCRGMLVYHANLGRRPLSFLLSHAVAPLAPFVALWAVLLLGAPRWWKSWEGAALVVGVGTGLLSYLVQAKGYPYQRYPLLAFVLLEVSLSLAGALRAAAIWKPLGWAGIVYGVLVVAPVSVWRASHFDWRNTEFRDLLDRDLLRLGGSELSGKVQCLDTAEACLSGLERAGIVQSTGFLYDEFLFGEDREGVVARTRAEFWRTVTRQPPEVFVVVDGLFPSGPGGYAKLDRWPAFKAYLLEHYKLFDQGMPHKGVRWWNRAMPPRTFRVFVSKPSQQPTSPLGEGITPAWPVRTPAA